MLQANDASLAAFFNVKFIFKTIAKLQMSQKIYMHAYCYCFSSVAVILYVKNYKFPVTIDSIAISLFVLQT